MSGAPAFVSGTRQTEASWTRQVSKRIRGDLKPKEDEEMDTVYLLWHSHPTGANENNDKLIGVYSSREKAKSAQERLAKQPGFKDYVEGFEIAVVS